MRPVLMLVALVTILAGTARAQEFTGTFKSPKITLTLSGTPAALTGTIEIQGKTYPVSGKVEGGVFAGTFRVAESEFPLRAQFREGRMVLTSAGRDFVLEREGGEGNPLGALEETPPPTPPGGQPPVGAAVLEALRDLAPPSPDPDRVWTVLVYMAADNDLELPGLIDLNEMEAGFPAKGVEVIALVDRSKEYTEDDGNWTDARVIRIATDDDEKVLRSPVLKELGEVNMGHPDVLAAFVEGALKAFPARRRMLVMWDHGSGWSAMANDFDDGAGKPEELTLAELRDGLSRGLRAAGVGRLDLIGFDMCLMGQLEVAVEVGDLARVMVASEALVPALGWDYHALLPLLTDRDSREIGKSVVESFYEFYEKRNAESVTLSVVDLDEVAGVSAALDALVVRLTPELERAWPTVSRALFFSESYRGRSDFRQGPYGTNSLDLLDVFKRVRFNLEAFPAEAEYQQLVAALGRTVVGQKVGNRRRLSNGMAIYAPLTARSMDPGYAKTRFGGASPWTKFLAALHALQTREVKRPVIRDVRIVDHAGKSVTALRPLDANRFEATIEGNNIIWVEAVTGARDEELKGLKFLSRTIVTDDQWLLRYEKLKDTAVHDIDLMLIRYVDGVNHVRTEFDGLWFAFTNGTDRATGTIDVSDVDQDAYLTVDVMLEHRDLGEKPVMGVAHVDSYSWEVAQIVVETPVAEGRVVTKKLALDRLPADLKFSPIHQVLTDDGKVILATGGTIEWREGVRFQLEMLPAMEYQAIVNVRTMGEVSASRRLIYKVEYNEEVDKLSEGWQYFRPELMEGTWDLYVIDEKKEKQPTKAVYHIRRKADFPNYYDVEVVAPDPKDNHRQIWLYDDQDLRNFRQFVLDERGRRTGMMTVPAFFNIKSRKATILGKMIDAGGMLFLWERREPAASELDRVEPVETPLPQPLR